MVTDQRASVRKILKVKAQVAMEGQAPMQVRTVDVGGNGVSVTVPEPMGVGRAGQVSFDVLVDGKAVTIAGRVKTMYCILSHGEFKVGFNFVNLEPNAMSQLARFLR